MAISEFEDVWKKLNEETDWKKSILEDRANAEDFRKQMLGKFAPAPSGEKVGSKPFGGLKKGEMFTAGMVSRRAGKSVLHEDMIVGIEELIRTQPIRPIESSVYIDEYKMPGYVVEDRKGKKWDTTEEQLAQFAVNNEQRCGSYAVELAERRQQEKIEAKKREAKRREFAVYKSAGDW